MTARRGGWGRCGTIVMLVAMLVGLVPTVAGAEEPAQTPVSRSEPKLGRAAATEPITVSLPLTPNAAALDAFLARAYDPQSPDYHHFLTPAEFTARFVDPAARQEAVSFLRNAGLTVHDTGVGVIVSAEGTAAQTERAFGVQLDTYRRTDGSTFIAADRAPALPRSVATRVRGVVGLDTSAQRKPHVVPGPAFPEGSRAAAPRTGGCSTVPTTRNAFTPPQLATAYNFDALHNAGFNGEGQTVALFELDNYNPTNVAVWQNSVCSATPITPIAVDGGTATGGGEVEVELDIDVILGLAPRLGNLLVYSAPNTDTGVVDAYNRIALDNAASAVSTSWGQCEAYNTVTASSEYYIFQQMAAQGMSVFAASGDTGTNDCLNGTISVDDPASQPYVSGVGGTHLALTSGTNAYAGETVWNNGSNYAGGGGLSSVWSQAAWQTGPGVTNRYSNGMRQVPDVAANADPYSGFVIYTLGNWAVYGGTSASAPLWAAGTALVNQSLAASGIARIGFGNPVWYRLLGQATAPYHDVTTGNNCIPVSPCAPDTYPATAGYDLATGVGTPDFGAIATALLPAVPIPAASVSGITPSIGPTTGGTTVTITGMNFRTGIVVRFGTQPATGVTLESSTTLTAVAPPQTSPGPVSVTVQNPAEAQSRDNITFAYILSPHVSAPTAASGPRPNIAPSGAHPAVATTVATPLPQPARHP